MEPVTELRPDTTVERMWKYLPNHEVGECWIWQGSLNTDGYGSIRPTRGVTTLAHRLVYTLLVGPIPAGMELDHLCRQRRCCNPEHLEPVTHRENILRGCSPSSLCSRKTNCSCGKELVPFTGKGRPKLRRYCPDCHRLKGKLAMRKWREENKRK